MKLFDIFIGLVMATALVCVAYWTLVLLIIFLGVIL